LLGAGDLKLKKMANSSSSSSGIGFFGLLGVAFIVLKLCKVIDWSWWLVTLPLWGGIGLILFILLVVIIIAVVAKR
jgi:hypothetical protein